MAEHPIRVSLVLASSTGGVGQHVRSLAAGLAGRGHRVTVCGPAATEELFGFTSAGARFAAVEVPAGPAPADVRAVRRLRRLLADADVVHAHGLRAGLLSGLALPRPSARRPRVAPPLVVTWHNALLGAGPRRAVLELLAGPVARRADVTLGASPDLADEAKRHGAPDARFVPVAAPGRAPAAAGQRAAVVGRPRTQLCADGRPVVLAIARLHRQKRLDLLVDAATRLAARRPPPVVAIAGDGPERTRLAGRIAAAHAPVTLLGHRRDADALLAAADVVVLCSDWEARPLVAQQALAAGRPLVATAVGGVPELVGDAALLVPPGDPAALADAVARVLDEPGLATRLGAAGPARAATWPDEDATVTAVAAVYAELLARRV